MPTMNEAVRSLVWSEYMDDNDLRYQPLIELIDGLDESIKNKFFDAYLFASVHAANLGMVAGYAAGVNPRSIMESKVEL